MPPLAIPNDPTAMWIVAAVIVLSAAAGGLLIRRVFQLLDANSTAASAAVNNVIAHFKEASTADRVANQANVTTILCDHKEAIREICSTHHEVVSELKSVKGSVGDLATAIRDHSHELQSLHSHVRAKPA